MDFNQFLAAVEQGTLRLSFTSLSKLLESPRHFVEYYTSSSIFSSPALEYGTLVHTLILEPNEFDNRYIIEPVFDKRTKAGKEEYQRFIEEAGDKKTISQQLFDEAQKAVDAFKSNKNAVGLLVGCDALECKVEFKYSGLTIKGIVDGHSNNGNYCFDLKTTQDCNPKNFKWSVLKYRYHLQAAIYTLGTGIDDFYIVAVEKSGHTAVFQISEQLLSEGRALLDKCCALYRSLAFSNNPERWMQSYWNVENDGIFIL